MRRSFRDGLKEGPFQRDPDVLSKVPDGDPSLPTERVSPNHHSVFVGTHGAASGSVSSSSAPLSGTSDS